MHHVLCILVVLIFFFCYRGIGDGTYMGIHDTWTGPSLVSSIVIFHAGFCFFFSSLLPFLFYAIIAFFAMSLMTLLGTLLF